MPLPDFVLGLRIGKTTAKEVDRTLVDAVQFVEVNQGDDDGQDVQPGFQITFAAQRDADKKPEYALLQKPELQPGNRVIITVTLQAKPRVLIDGVITHQQLVFGSGNGDASLIITGRDISVMMDLEEKVASHKKMQHKAIVEKILKSYAKWGVQGEVKASAKPWPKQPPDHAPMQWGTDRAYLRSLAAANSYLFFIRPGPQPGSSVAYWGPPDRSGEVQPALTVNMGTATNVEAIHFSYDAMAPTKVIGAVTDPNTAKPTIVDIRQSKRKPTLAKTAALNDQNPLLRTHRLRYAGPDPDQATARAQAITDQSTDRVVVGTGTLDAVVYGEILQAPGVVGVRGVGNHYDGTYYVKAVKHRITLATYKQEFTITREGVGSTTQQVKL